MLGLHSLIFANFGWIEVPESFPLFLTRCMQLHNAEEISQLTLTKNSLKVTILTVFLSLQRVTLWCHVGLKVYGNIYWRIIESYSSKHPANCSCHQVTRTTGTAVTVASTVQLRYIRTTHTRIIRSYFAYTRMSIRAHTRVYTRVYVSLLCIPIRFFIWSIVGQTKDILFYGNEKGFKAKFAYC